MVALSDRKIEIVRTLVESAPDKVVGGLQKALAETGEESSLAGVRQLVDAEAADRLLRNAVFLPMVPLCIGSGASKHHLTFPSRALALLWRGLKTIAPTEIGACAAACKAVSAAMASQQRPPDTSQVFDGVVAMAADALRNSDLRDFRVAAELCERGAAGGATTFANCLDIAPVVRRAVSRMPDWLAHPTEEHNAAARLAFKDAVEIAPDAGPTFFEMLAAHLAPPWMVLRVISAVMDKPTERYLSDSELGGFAERVMAEIDQSLKSIRTMDLDAGPEVGRRAAALVGLITEQTYELEFCMELNREHGWGKRILEQKQALAAVVEGRLKEAEKLAISVLPTGSSRLSRLRKQTPRFDSDPDLRGVARARTVLAFIQEIRQYAGNGGFSAMHTKINDKLAAMIDHYAEETVDMIRTGHADPHTARIFMRIAAELDEYIRGSKAAELIRRRAASAEPETHLEAPVEEPRPKRQLGL